MEWGSVRLDLPPRYDRRVIASRILIHASKISFPPSFFNTNGLASASDCKLVSCVRTLLIPRPFPSLPSSLSQTISHFHVHIDRHIGLPRTPLPFSLSSSFLNNSSTDCFRIVLAYRKSARFAGEDTIQRRLRLRLEHAAVEVRRIRH